MTSDIPEIMKDLEQYERHISNQFARWLRLPENQSKTCEEARQEIPMQKYDLLRKLVELEEKHPL